MAQILWEVNSPGRLMFNFKTKKEAKKLAESLTGHDYVEVNRCRDGNVPTDETVAIYQRGTLAWSK